MNARLIPALLVLGCTPPVAAPPPPIGDLAAPASLAERGELPSLFKSFTSDDEATDVAAFTTWRREQLVALFAHYQYGATPPRVPVAAQLTASYDDLVPGARWEEYTLTLGDDELAVLHLALVRPNGVTRPPVILGVNKCGNQSLTDDPRVRLSSSFVIPACGTSAATTRGAQETLWPLEAIVARGYAVATFHESDAAPDASDRFTTGLRSRFRPEGPARAAWKTIAIWAWALAHAASWLDAQPDLDSDRLTVFGHSRRGKAALLAGTLSPELDAVIAHQSGTAGAALHRSLEGETIELITLAFPHWFNDVFPEFANAELKTPIDQHQLLALWAPRRVVLVDGADDAWADPQGARQAAEAAAPAWDLFSQPGRITWQTRPGAHSVESSDWTLFLDALER